MSVLFVANCTKQDHDFVYITPETGKPRLVRIETGSQKQIHTSDNEMNLNAIVKQHEPYGLIPVNEVKRNRAFTGMCYSFDKPVPVDAIMVADEQNTAILEKFSDNVFKQTAVAIQDQLSRNDEAPAFNLETEIVEIGGQAKVAKGVRVGDQRPTQQQTKRKR